MKVTVATPVLNGPKNSSPRPKFLRIKAVFLIVIVSITQKRRATCWSSPKELRGLSLKTSVCKLGNVVARSDTSSKREMLFWMRLSSVRLGNCEFCGLREIRLMCWSFAVAAKLNCILLYDNTQDKIPFISKNPSKSIRKIMGAVVLKT
jgi:hypothetical protein